VGQSEIAWRFLYGLRFRGEALLGHIEQDGNDELIEN
jgi:hypothetical protein